LFADISLDHRLFSDLCVGCWFVGHFSRLLPISSRVSLPFNPFGIETVSLGRFIWQRMDPKACRWAQ
jgi:hypothetical protein